MGKVISHTYRALIALIALVALTLASLAQAAADDVPAGKYVLEPTHGYITFSYSHLGFSTPHVSFNDFDVDLNFDPAAPEKSTLSVTIDAASIDSRVDEFDEHLVGERFFDVANHPTITFVSTKVVPREENAATVTGDLTIKGISHSIELSVVMNKSGMHPMLKKPVMGFNAQAGLQRSQFDLGYAVPMVGDEITLYVTAEMQSVE